MRLLSLAPTLILALALIAPPALAEEGDGNLRRLEVGVLAGHWAAVGRIDAGDRGFCTGTLIAPDVVLTAAHCLFDRTTGTPFPLSDLTFRAGWRDGRAEAYRGVVRAMPHPDYRLVPEETEAHLDQVGRDVALLRLDQPILLPSLPPAATGPAPTRGEAVAIVSYAKDRAEAPSIQDACRAWLRQGLAVLDCPVEFGASGAPVFRETDRGQEVVSVIAAKAESDGRPVALAVPVAPVMAMLQAGLAGADRTAPAGVRVLSGGAARTGGAKFLRVDEAP